MAGVDIDSHTVDVAFVRDRPGHYYLLRWEDFNGRIPFLLPCSRP